MNTHPAFGLCSSSLRGHTEEKQGPQKSGVQLLTSLPEKFYIK